MKTIDEIRKDSRVIVSETADDGCNGFVTLRSDGLRKRDAQFVLSYGAGWDHVSVSLYDRCPTWTEMCQVKEIFFRDDEVCVQYHPKKDDYINNHPNCLHIFRPQYEEIPSPPYWMVGFKPGDTPRSVNKMYHDYIRHLEEMTGRKVT